jgi:hypothetical protein
VIFSIKKGDLVRWEAIVCEELGLPLTDSQEKALGSLPSFSDDPSAPFAILPSPVAARLPNSLPKHYLR